MNNEKTVVIYHRSDYDGLMSGAICKRAMPNAELIGWEYGDPTPTIEDDALLYIVDLSVPDLMNHPRLVWIDHHKSAIERYGVRAGLQIDGVAACRLCWQWVNGTRDASKEDYVERRVDEPELVRLLGEYDIWDHRDERTKRLQLAMRNDGVDLEQLGRILDSSTYTQDQIIAQWSATGKILETYQKQMDADLVNKRGYEVEFEGLRFVALNTGFGNSISFDAYHNIENVDAFMMYRWIGDKFVCSLYHSPRRTDLDLSVIASKYGGGGPRGACGFEVYDMDVAKRVFFPGVRAKTSVSTTVGQDAVDAIARILSYTRKEGTQIYINNGSVPSLEDCDFKVTIEEL